MSSSNVDLTINQAAILGDDGNIYTLPRPARHNNIIAYMRNIGYDGSIRNQGFILSDGRYVDRDIAKTIALNNGQVTKLINNAVLLSEDLW
jgi:hypothetical protein